MIDPEEDEMVTDRSEARPRIVAACPWCGSGTPLSVVGDGMGNQSLCCTACGCKGPPTPIGGDFVVADEGAISRWSHRSAKPCQVDPAVSKRIRHAVAFQALLGERLSPDTNVSLRLADLDHILKAAGAPIMEQQQHAA
jgi:hypothetical protein